MSEPFLIAVLGIAKLRIARGITFCNLAPQYAHRNSIFCEIEHENELDFSFLSITDSPLPLVAICMATIIETSLLYSSEFSLWDVR